MGQVKERSEKILGMAEAELTGFYYPSREEAIASSLRIVERAEDYSGLVYYDIDDTLKNSERWLRWWLNTVLKNSSDTFRSVKLEEVQTHGGRYYQVPAYQEAAQNMGREFYEVFTSEVATNQELHALINPHIGAQQAQLELLSFGMGVGGYPTARPHELARVTAASLKHHKFLRAPVIDVLADSGDPHHAKVAFFRDTIAPHLPKGLEGKTYLIDDHIETAVGILEQCGGKIVPVVAIVPRNRNRIPELLERGILHGTIRDIPIIIKNSQA